MLFKLHNPDISSQLVIKLTQGGLVEEAVNRLGPVKLVSGAYDWPNKYYSFRGWTDKLNSLWWPDGGDNFSTLVVLISDAQNDILSQLVDAQKPKVDCWHLPYLLFSIIMLTNRGLIDGTTNRYQYPSEFFIPGGQLTGVTQDTPLIEYKLYPLPPINLSSLTPDKTVRGWWLLPLVDIRYFMRNVPLNAFGSGSSSSSCGTEPGYPIIEIDNSKPPNWMPPLVQYPTDLPLNYQPILNNGTWPAINGSMRWGEAADLQATMENWRIACRDVRSNFSIPGGGGTPHSNFTGVVSDRPEDWSLLTPTSYHLDACNFLLQPLSRLAGGDCDVRSLDDLTARKLQFTFRVTGTDAFFCVTIAANVDYPVKLTDLIEDVDGPSPDEAKIIPLVDLGVPCSSRNPGQAEHDQLVTAAKTWALWYYAWRHKQAYMVFPGIYPVMPNGHAKVIRWDFGGEPNTWRTIYISLEGVQGTDQSYCVQRTPFYVQIDGEGALQDNLHGFYAYTELEDKNGQLSNTLSTPRKGFVLNVNGSTKTINPARDEAGKVAVPVGLVVWLKPGVPYLDMNTSQIFDHYLFTTTDLLQVVRLKSTLEFNKHGHVGIIIQRWNPDINGFVDSNDGWGVILQ